MKEHHAGLYERFLLSGMLYDQLTKIGACYSGRMGRMIRQMTAAEGINEELKEKSQLARIGRMSNIRQQVEEIVLTEMIYA